MTVTVMSASHYRESLPDGAELPTLDNQLNQVCREPLRRIDRFVQLALIGSGRCVAGQRLAPDCGLYLGSGFGPMSNNISTQEQLIRDHQLPKPFNFINTLGNSAGFYIARNLRLSGQNLFVSRRAASFTAILSLAMADLAAGVSAQALVGLVNEVTLPLFEYRKRHGLPLDTIPAEASHWLLLEVGGSAGITLEQKLYADIRDLENAVSIDWRNGDVLHCTADTEAEFAKQLRARFACAEALAATAGVHDCLEAAWFAEFASLPGQGSLFVVSGSAQRGWTLLHCRT